MNHPAPVLPSSFRLLLAVVVPALLGVAGVYLAVRFIEVYGWTLFGLLPILQSLLSSLIYRITGKARWRACYGVSLLSVLFLGALILLFALDGLICLLMALPLAAILCLFGSHWGYLLGRRFSVRKVSVVPLIALLTFPLFQAFEQTQVKQPRLHEVTTKVSVAAPIEQVWQEVIAFDRITAPPEGLFRLGIAYPIEATIEGEGIGAIRNCIFSTGPFVEPITRWEAPCLLEFAVSSNPPVLKEVSPWGAIEPAHLHRTFTSERGRFRLYEENGRTVLEGTTWYRQAIAPDFYWHRISDYLIHRIHLRVLEHIRDVAEHQPRKEA